MYRRRTQARTSVMVLNPLTESSPRCRASDHPVLMPHQLADLWRMKGIEANCHSLPVPSVCLQEGEGEGEGARGESPPSSSGAGHQGPDSEPEVRATVRMGILADKPGAGKSYTVMEMLLSPDPPAVTEVYHQVSHHMSYRTLRPRGDTPAPVSVLVFPHNLTRQWQNLLTARIPGNRLAFVSKSSALAKAVELIDSAAGVGGATPLEPASAPADGVSPRDPQKCPAVVATTASGLPAILQHISSKRITVSRIVYDEADSLRLTKCAGHSNVARFHWFVTASPHNLYSVMPDPGAGYGMFTGGRIEYRHAKGTSVQSLMYGCPYVHSGYVREFFVSGSAYSLAIQNCLCAVTVISDDEFVEASFSVPAAEETTVVTRAEVSSSLLHGIVNRSVIDRLNAGDVRGALATLNPACVSSETNVVAAAVKTLQATLANLRAQLQYTGARTYADESAREAATERIESRIRSTSSQIENLGNRITGAEVCPICYDEIADKTVVPCCSNSFCLACITKWLVGDGGTLASHSACPMCKSTLSPGGLMVIRAGADPGDACPGDAGPENPGPGPAPLPGFSGDPGRGKIDNLRALMQHFAVEFEREGTPRRILVFSDNDEIMKRVAREVMTQEEVPHAFLKSNAAVINARTRDFRETPRMYALLTNIKYYGSGLDLSAATDIVLMHKIQEGMAAQVIGRAQRPPRTERLRIWKFRSSLEDEY